MKQQKLIMLDRELIDQLQKEENASSLINKLLIDYYHAGKHLELDQIDKTIQSLKKNEQENQEKIASLITRKAELEIKEAERKQVFKDIPQDILDEFKEFTAMTEETLETRFINSYFKKYKVTWEQVLQAFRKFKENGVQE